EDQRVLGVGLLDRRLVLDGEELALAARVLRMRRVQELRPGMRAVRARPLDALLVETVVADARPVGRQVGELVPRLLRARVLPVGAERVGEIDDDSPVLSGVSR